MRISRPTRDRVTRLFPFFALLALSLLSVSCSKPGRGPERIKENGAEVVLNGETPYAVRGEKTSLVVREEFKIDLEESKFAALGLSDVAKADMDSQGRIYLFQRAQGDAPLVFEFDDRGTFRKSFGRQGQGPGEIESPYCRGISGRDEIFILDSSTQKILYFDPDGALLRTAPIPQTLSVAGRLGLSPLADGNYLVQYFRIEEGSKIRKLVVGVFDEHFQKIKDLAECDPGSTEKISNPFTPVPVFGHSRDAIFLGFENGTDISVFDLNGILRRIVRRRFPQVEIPASFRNDLLKRLPANHPLRTNLKLPRYYPAFQFFFSDDLGHLFVATCEKDKASGQNMCEVFTPDGVYIQRVALGYFDILKWLWEGQPGEVVIRNGRALCVRDKESGFREIVVSSIRWF